MENQQTNVIITRSPKSMGISCILTFLFGSLGLFYSTIIGGIIMLIIEIIVAIVTLGIGLIATHLVAIIWGAVATNSYNKKLISGKI